MSNHNVYLSSLFSFLSYFFGKCASKLLSIFRIKTRKSRSILRNVMTPSDIIVHLFNIVATFENLPYKEKA